MGSGEPDVRRLRPTKLVELALTNTMLEFVQLVGCHYILLFMLTDDDPELLQGLSSTSSSQDQLAFQTDIHGMDARNTLAPVSGSRRPQRRTSEFTAEEQTAERAVPDLTRMLCYAAPIIKRAQVSFLREVSVGRARNHDIVLRHPSVSKFHATFDHMPSGDLQLTDRESRNGTMVNGERVQGRVTVVPGDIVRFGNVSARIGTTEGFHRLVRA
ncbi:MAG: hypothetical protein RL385_3895 [Pseudomonadota bacterium]